MASTDMEKYQTDEENEHKNIRRRYKRGEKWGRQSLIQCVPSFTVLYSFETCNTALYLPLSAGVREMLK